MHPAPLPPELQQALLPAMRLHAAGQLEEALQAYAALLARSPHPQIQNMLYEACLAHPCKAMADHPLTHLIRAQPKLMPLRSVAIQLARKLGDTQERLKHLEAMHRAGPVGIDSFYVEYGAMLRNSGQFDRALQVIGAALTRFPQSVDLLRLRSGVYEAQGNYSAALADASTIVARKPDDLPARLMLGLQKLLTSDCREGYAEFSALRDRSYLEHGLRYRSPAWRGEPLAGKHLFLLANEGIGDIVMYAGFFPWLLAQGARITLNLPLKLVPLFARSFPEITLTTIAPAATATLADGCDYHLILSELMALALPHYRPADHPPYLKADLARSAALRATYQAASPPATRYIGIAWHTKNAEVASRRNIPLRDWKPLLTLPGVQCVSLQYGDQAAEIAAANAPLLVDATLDAFDDIDGLAAQIAAMDEVVSIDNVTVHLAGALGVPTTMLLGAASEWRWGLDRTDCHWYGSLRSRRQKRFGAWQREMRETAEGIAKQAAADNPQSAQG